ncbi:MAG: hypothetical protein ACM3ON_13610, partial [Chloroflexota bacterium]
LTLRMITHDWLIIAPPLVALGYPFELPKYKPSRVKIQVMRNREAKSPGHGTSHLSEDQQPCKTTDGSAIEAPGL